MDGWISWSVSNGGPYEFTLTSKGNWWNRQKHVEPPDGWDGGMVLPQVILIATATWTTSPRIWDKTPNITRPSRNRRAFTSADLVKMKHPPLSRRKRPPTANYLFGVKVALNMPCPIYPINSRLITSLHWRNSLISTRLMKLILQRNLKSMN